MGELHALLNVAAIHLVGGRPGMAIEPLSQALGCAKRMGQHYAAGRILTAIRQAHKASQLANGPEAV